MKANLAKMRGSTIHYMVLYGMTDSLMEVLRKGKKKNEPEGEVELILTVNGEEVDLQRFCDRWQEQVGGMIADKAQEIVVDKCNDIFDDFSESINDFSKKFNKTVYKRLKQWVKKEEERENNVVG